MKTITHPPIKDVRLESVLYALSDPVRLSVVWQLAENGEMTCGQFVCCEQKGKSTMTHHFRVLRDSGLINTRVSGREHLTTLRRKELDARFPGLLDTILSAAGSATSPKGRR